MANHMPLLPDAEWAEVHRAHRLLRQTGARIDAVAEVEGWPVPFGALRFLVLAHVDWAGRLGISPRRLAYVLELPRSTLGHHLAVLDGEEMILRSPRGLYDGRRVTVRIAPRGRFALARFRGALRREPDAPFHGPSWPLEP